MAVVVPVLSCETTTSGPDSALSVVPASVGLQVGESFQLTAAGAVGPVVWTTGNPQLATVVRATGFVTAVGVGSTVITATDDQTSASATVTVTARPSIALSVPSVAMDAVEGGANPADAAITVSNAGGGTVDGLAVGTVEYGTGQIGGWLSATLAGTTAPTTLTIGADVTGLPAGSYSASVPVMSPVADNTPQSLIVSLTVAPPPQIVVDPAAATFQAVQPADPAPVSVAITNGGGGSLEGLAAAVTYGAGPLDGWLSATLDAATAPATLTLTASATGLVPGEYTATVRVSSTTPGTTSVDVPVTFVLEPPPSIDRSTTVVRFSAEPGGPDPAPRTVTITNGGGGVLDGLVVGPPQYGAGEPTGWLTATLDRTTAPAVITFQATTGSLAIGTYTAVVTVSSPVASTPRDITVTFEVTPAPVIDLSATAVQLSAPVGSDPQPADVQITNGGGGTLSGLSTSTAYGSGGAAGWLVASLSGTTAPATLSLAANTAGLAIGTYTAVVTVSSSAPNVADRTVDVTLQVAPAASIGLSRSAVAFSAYPGSSDPSPETVDITNQGGGTLSGLAAGPVSYGAGQPTGWLAVSLSGSDAPATLTLTAQVGSLGVGTYTATLPVTSPVADNSPQSVTVTFQVQDPPQIVLSQSSLTFSRVLGAGPTPSQAVSVTNGGGGTLSGLGAWVSYVSGGGSGWLTAQVYPTTAPAVLTIGVDIAGLAAGTYTADVTVTAPGVPSEILVVELRVLYSFSAHVLPVFQTLYPGFSGTPCTQCHTAGANTPPDFSSVAQAYTDLQQSNRVFPGDSINGDLICKITGMGTCSITSDMRLPAAQVHIIKVWIAQGALNN